jgi:hypothetical protein
LQRSRTLRDLKGVGSLVVVIALGNLAQFILQTVWVLYTTFRFNWTPQQNGWSLFLVGASGLLVQGFLLKRMIGRLGSQRLVVAGLVSATICHLGWALATQGWMMYALIAANLLSYAVVPTIQSMVSAAADERTQGQTMGSVAALGSLASVLAPMIGAPLLGFVSHLPANDWRMGRAVFSHIGGLARLQHDRSGAIPHAAGGIKLPRMAKSAQQAGLLSGIRVVEAASMVMVPSVGAALADFGAQVIKIEPLEGDLNRLGHKIPGMPLHDYEYCFPPGQPRQAQPFARPEGAESRDILRRLVERADIFLTNHRPKSLDGLGLDWPALQAINPRLIYAHGTGLATRATRSTSRASTRSATGRAREWRRISFRSRAGSGRSATAPAIIRPAWRCCRRCCLRFSRASALAKARGYQFRSLQRAPGRTR